MKPDAATSESLALVGRDTRWTFAVLWTHCDDEGRALRNYRLIKAAIYPLDDEMTPAAIETELATLARVGCLCFYEVEGKEYLHVPSWSDHQHPNRKVDSKLPACPKSDHSFTVQPQRTADAVSPQPQSSPVVVVGEVVVDGVGEVAVAPASATTSATIVAEWMEHVPKRPPGAVVGQTAKLINQMLSEGIDPDDIRRGLAAWMAKGLHPSTLPSVVNEVMNAPAQKPTPLRRTTDDKVRDGLNLAQRLAAEHPIAQREIS